MSLEREVRDVNSLITILGSLDRKIRGAMKVLEDRKETAKMALKKLVKEKLAQSPNGLNDLLWQLGEDFEIYPYADQIASVDRALACLRRLQNLITSLKLRLTVLRELLLMVSQLGPEMRKVKKTVDILEKGMEKMRKGVAEIESSTTEILERIGMGIDEISTGLMPSMLFSGELEDVMKEMVSELEKELREEGITLPRASSARELQAGSGLPSSSPAQAVAVQVKPPEPHEEYEKLVLDYIRKNGGKIDIGECIKELGLPAEKVLEALKKLLEKGLIKIGGQAEGACLAREGA